MNIKIQKENNIEVFFNISKITIKDKEINENEFQPYNEKFVTKPIFEIFDIHNKCIFSSCSPKVIERGKKLLSQDIPTLQV